MHGTRQHTLAFEQGAIALMRGFRSPLLQALPKDRFKGAAERAARRLFISGLLVLIVFTLFFFVRQKVLPIGGFYWFYWFHDYIYLGLKGAVFSRYYPWSLAWLGVGGSLILLGWLTFVLGKSPLQAPHAFLVRWASRNSALHPLLTGLAELFKRMGLPMTMMRSAVAVERQIQLNGLFRLRSAAAERRLGYRFLKQSDFWIGLALVHREEPNARQQTLSIGLATLLWVDPVLSIDPKRPEHRVLNGMIARLVRLLPLPKDAQAFNEAIAWPASLDEGSIALDTLLLFSGFVPGGEDRLAEALVGMNELVAFGDLVRLRLVQATEDRLAIFETMRQGLEMHPFALGKNRQLENQVPTRDPEMDGLWREQAHQALLLACHTARLLEEPDLLGRYLDAIEALAIVAEAASPSPDSPLADLRHHGLVITEGLPTTEIYRFAAKFALVHEAHEWEQRRGVTWPDGIPGTGHTREPWALSAALLQAAGREGERLAALEVGS